MVRIFQIAISSCAVLLLAGCNAAEKDKPAWQQVKITDIAPSHSGQMDSQLLKTINVNVYIFEIPVENIGVLDTIRPMLHTKPLQFNDYNAFSANLFSAGFGQIQIWNKISDLLRDAGAKRIETASLLLPDSESNDFSIARLSREQTIFYILTPGSMQGATIGPGKFALRIKAEKIPGSRGVCKMSILPVFSSPVTSPIPQIAARQKSAEFIFTCCGFKSKLSPGDFVLLGPKKYTTSQITLGSLFFSRPRHKPVVRAYLIVCTRIID